MGHNGNFIALAGKRFGELIVQHRSDLRGLGKNVLWVCKCSCGNEVLVRSDKLLSGRKVLCNLDGHNRKRGAQGGLAKQYPREYSSFSAMRHRCRQQLATYKNVLVCKRWDSFANFISDMGRKPTPEHSIDRYPNPWGNYEPSNCRWATTAEQCRNKRNSIYIEYRGIRILLIDAINSFGVAPELVRSRLDIGWSLERALTTPLQPRGGRKKELPVPVEHDT